MGAESHLLHSEGGLLILPTKGRQKQDPLVLTEYAEEADGRFVPRSCFVVSNSFERVVQSKYIRFTSPEKHFSKDGKYSCSVGAIRQFVTSCSERY